MKFHWSPYTIGLGLAHLCSVTVSAQDYYEEHIPIEKAYRICVGDSHIDTNGQISVSGSCTSGPTKRKLNWDEECREVGGIFTGEVSRTLDTFTHWVVSTKCARKEGGPPLSTPDVGYRESPLCLLGYNPRRDFITKEYTSCAKPIRYEVTANPSLTRTIGDMSCDVSGGTNPINIFTGNKFQRENDYTSADTFPLKFDRLYNSYFIRSYAYNVLPTTGNWTNTFSRAVKVYGPSSTIAAVQREDNKLVFFSKVENAWRSATDSDSVLRDLIDSSGVHSGWEYHSPSEGVKEIYDETGLLLNIVNRTNIGISLTYSDGKGGLLYSEQASRSGFLAPTCANELDEISAKTKGLLICATHSSGKALLFSYKENELLASITDPAGSTTKYNYGESSARPVNGIGSKNLTSVQRSDNSIRRFFYNESDKIKSRQLPNALTGIVDENGNRSSNWTYDSDGWATSSDHGPNIDKKTIFYDKDARPRRASVTDTRGAVNEFRQATILGIPRSTGSTQPAGSGCPASNESASYDATGKIMTRTNFNKVVTEFQYKNSTNLEIKRIEARGTPIARTITTEWNPELKLPARISEPKRITDYNYDNLGNMLQKIEQATLDNNGQNGFSAIRTGVKRLWEYSYNKHGDLANFSDPSGSSTTYTYDLAGNLAEITNAIGHTTTFSNYDANGRVGKVIDPNGLITTMTYSDRGWLVSKNVGNKITMYEYDRVGNLVKVSLPNGASYFYSYDVGNRLIKIDDTLGNSIAYLLDGEGNRVQETVRDSSGSLSQQTIRVFDSLNRLQNITSEIQ